MKSRTYIAALALIAMVGGASMGGPRGRLENEDMRFIRDWQREQRVRQWAAVLNLSREQLTLLQGVRAEVETVKGEFEAGFADIEARLQSAAAEVRGRIEQSGQMTEEDRELIEDLRQERRNLGRELKLRLQVAAIPLEGFLNDEQRQTLGDLHRRDREKGRERKNRAERGERIRHRGEHGELRGKRMLLRALLSDAFLDYYED